jgi:superoxide dismutase, Cu-Zn family
MKTILAAAAFAALFALAGCQENDRDTRHGRSGDHRGRMHDNHRHGRAPGDMNPNADRGSSQQGRLAVANVTPSRAATTQPAMNNVRGTVTFTPEGDEAVRVSVEVTGLPPNSTHGFHVHEKGDLSAPDLSSAGAHWDPHGTQRHGGPEDDHKHAGDLGNLTSDGSGKATLNTTLRGVSLNGQNSLVGKSVIIHAKADDLKSQPSGDSGGRIAGGVIEMK